MQRARRFASAIILGAIVGLFFASWVEHSGNNPFTQYTGRALAQQEQPVVEYDCIRLNFVNWAPYRHAGVIMCNVELTDTLQPTVDEVNEIAQCLAGTGKKFDMNVLAQYRYWYTDDIIGYPMKPGRIIIGYTDIVGKNIFVRRNLAVPNWGDKMIRDVLVHEIVHAITLEGGHDEGAFDTCSPKEF